MVGVVVCGLVCVVVGEVCVVDGDGCVVCANEKWRVNTDNPAKKILFMLVNCFVGLEKIKIRIRHMKNHSETEKFAGPFLFVALPLHFGAFISRI